MNNITIVAIWIVCGLLAGSSVNATYRAELTVKESHRRLWSSEKLEREGAINAMVSFIPSILGGPIALGAASIFTGLFSDGFSFRCDGSNKI